MFIVVYEWHVPHESMKEFHAAWRSATESIHGSVDGALGSFMLRSHDVSEKTVTVAKWRTRKDWEAFWAGGNPQQMQEMRRFGERVSVESFDLVEDRTKKP